MKPNMRIFIRFYKDEENKDALGKIKDKKK